MPDTGAPWNIPYAAPSDLVRDWPELSEDVADAVAAGLDGASFVKQVVTAVKTDVFTGSGTTFVDVTGLNLSITPSSTSSRIILYLGVGVIGNATDQSAVLRLLRDSTVLSQANSFGSRIRGVGGSRHQGAFSPTPGPSVIVVDTPNTTSATTYKAQMAGSSAYSINRPQSSTDNTTYPLGISSLVAIELSS
jgi:hypothetical protein